MWNILLISLIYEIIVFKFKFYHFLNVIKINFNWFFKDLIQNEIKINFNWFFKDLIKNVILIGFLDWIIIWF